MPQSSTENESANSFKTVFAEKVVTFFIKHPFFRQAITPPLSYLFKPPALDDATWDREYTEGHWAYLGDLAEMPRYALIAGFMKFLQPAASVLDVGCGNGQLVDWVYRDNAQQYVGIDISKVAVEQARLKKVGQARFEVADGTNYRSEEKFDVIIFNEVLYYPSDPAAVLNHYKSLLNPNGAFIISMVRAPGALKTWRRCRPQLELIGDARCRGTNGIEWDVRLCRPK